MSAATLLNFSRDPRARSTFAFEHAMATRNYYGLMHPLDRFSVLPYLLDPIRQMNPAGPWHRNHQQAHNDALTSVPMLYGSDKIGLYVGQNIQDSNVQIDWQRSWWTFQNKMEHYIADNSVLPAAGTDWMWPFW